MSRRILAAAVIVTLGILGAPSRLSGEPTTSSAPSSLVLGPGDSPNPLRLYPRRPGAKYEDVEAPTTAPVNLGLVRLRIVTSRIEPHIALPPRAVPGSIAEYEKLGLADGYSPITTRTPDNLLRVRVRANGLVATAISCVATATDDGTVLLPYDLPARPTPSTTTMTAKPAPVDYSLYFPIGTRSGRVYLTCLDSFYGTLFGTDTRAVWAIHV